MSRDSASSIEKVYQALNRIDGNVNPFAYPASNSLDY